MAMVGPASLDEHSMEMRQCGGLGGVDKRVR